MSELRRGDVDDPAALRALAHPLRLELLEQLTVAEYLRTRDRRRDWDAAAIFSNSTMHLTKTELAEFGEALVELVQAYWRPPEARPPGARAVAAQLYAFPWPGDVPEEEP